MKLKYCLFIIPLLLLQKIHSQSIDSGKQASLRRQMLIIGNAGAYAGSYLSLYHLWYKNYESTSFHFFNDSREWLQMDKAGHFYASYYFTKYQTALFGWSGMNKKQRLLAGSLASFLHISSIEIMDGYSAAWGASVSDLLANIAGIGLYTSQIAFFDKEYIIPKYSFNAKSSLNLRTDVLGKNSFEQLIKDYNSLTIWLSFNIQELTKIEKIPPFINLAVGYGAKNMLGGMENPVMYGAYDRQRQYYLALDLDLTKIQTQKKWLKGLFYCLNMIKMPLPTIEYSSNSVRFYPVYF